MTSNSGRLGLHHAPMAFPRQGEAMLSFALNSQRALPGLAWDLALSRIEIQPSEVEEHVILEALPVAVAA